MAAITPVDATGKGTLYELRDVSAQATTGQTDYIVVPAWARRAIVYFNLTANAGTSPISTVSFQVPPPNTFVDTDLVQLATGASVTAASQHIYHIGPGETGIADGTDQAAADASMGINATLPWMLGVKVLNDRTTGDETYTYTLKVVFSR